MTEADLQKKLQEWLAIKGEADALEKAINHEEGVHQRSIIPQRTTPHMENHNSSASGDDVRSAKSFPNLPPTKAMGNAKEAHRMILHKLKAMPKANLPKSELEKAKWTPEFHRQQVDIKGVNKPQMSSTPGQSNMGTVVRQANQAPKATLIDKLHAKMGGPTISQTKEGKMDSAKGYAKHKLNEMQSMPKPNLTRSEEKLDKNFLRNLLGRSKAPQAPKVDPVKHRLMLDGKSYHAKRVFGATHEQSLAAVNQGRQRDGLSPIQAEDPIKKNDYLKGMMKQLRQQKKLPETPQAGATIDYSKMKTAPQGIVEGQRMTPRNVSSSGPKSDKLFDPRLSGKIKKSLMAQPAAVSEPTIVTTRAIRDNPKEVQSPNTLNAYKDKK